MDNHTEYLYGLLAQVDAVAEVLAGYGSIEATRPLFLLWKSVEQGRQGPANVPAEKWLEYRLMLELARLQAPAELPEAFPEELPDTRLALARVIAKWATAGEFDLLDAAWRLCRVKLARRN